MFPEQHEPLGLGFQRIHTLKALQQRIQAVDHYTPPDEVCAANNSMAFQGHHVQQAIPSYFGRWDGKDSWLQWPASRQNDARELFDPYLNKIAHSALA